jgi:RNA polymerase sigma-70 factor (ECF subfamily)
MSETREERFSALYDSTRPKIIAYVLRRTASRDDAADIVAETYEVAWRRMDDVPTGDAGLLWLYVTARNVLANHGRRLRRRHEVAAQLAQELRAVELSDKPSHEDGLTIRLCLKALAPADRELLMLSGWEGLTPVEIGRVLGCSPTAARIRLHRARTRLKEMSEYALPKKQSGDVGHTQEGSSARGCFPEEVVGQ